MKNAAFIYLFLLFVTSCTTQVLDKLSPEEFSAKIKNETTEYKIIDLRTDEEIAQGKVPGADQLDYFEDDFTEKLNALDKETTYYIYCAAGGRSDKAQSQMSELGFKTVYDLRGGMKAWNTVGLETE